MPLQWLGKLRVESVKILQFFCIYYLYRNKDVHRKNVNIGNNFSDGYSSISVMIII